MVAARANELPGYGVLHGAAGFVSVRAVRETAMRHEGPKIAEVAFHFLRPRVPESELPHSRRIDHPAAEVQLDELRVSRRVTALLIHVADGFHGQPKFRLHGVEQRRFTDARLPREDRRPTGEQSAEAADAGAAAGAREDRRDA